jgi:hypothetical protein
MLTWSLNQDTYKNCPIGIKLRNKSFCQLKERLYLLDLRT